MEKMPYQPELERAENIATPSTATSSDWRAGLPVLTGDQFVLRELRIEDAPTLLAMLTTEEVARFISPPPTTVEGFERFISWTMRQRAAGTGVCFAVTVRGTDTAIGIFQIREFEPGFATAEWGFAIGSPFWGTGVFGDAAGLVLEFAFGTLGAHRIEARAAAANGRGTGALLKIGAVPEAVLRRSFLCRGEYLDQVLYGIVEDEWRAARRPASRRFATATALVH
jgi:ribosomal-protein-alanine N-acetyltransferase